MIVDDLHVFGSRIGPPEHDPPLIIDADRVLTRQIAQTEPNISALSP
jgi:hypothetical protein